MPGARSPAAHRGLINLEQAIRLSPIEPRNPCSLVAIRMHQIVATRLIGRARSRSVQHHLATLDPLTGLVTQTVFHSRLGPTVRLSSRASMPMAVAVIDMDGFRDLERRRGRRFIDTSRFHSSTSVFYLRVAPRRSLCLSSSTLSAWASPLGARRAAVYP